MLASPLIKFCTICTCYFSSKLFSARNFKEPLKESILQHTKGIEMYHETKLFQVTLFLFFFSFFVANHLFCDVSGAKFFISSILSSSGPKKMEKKTTIHYILMLSRRSRIKSLIISQKWLYNYRFKLI